MNWPKRPLRTWKYKTQIIHLDKTSQVGLSDQMTEGSWGGWWKRGEDLQHYSPKWSYFGGAIASLSKWVKVGKSDSFKCIWCYHQHKSNWGLTYHIINFYWDFTCLWLWDLDGSDPVLASDKSRDSLTNQSVPGKEKVLTRPCGNRLIYNKIP